VLNSEVLTQEVPYLGNTAEMNFYVEGLRFPDKDFNGLIRIHLSLLEPIATVRPATQLLLFHLLTLPFHFFWTQTGDDAVCRENLSIRGPITVISCFFYPELSTTCHIRPFVESSSQS